MNVVLSTLKAALSSRKFIYTVAGVLGAVGVRYLDLPEEQATEVAREILLAFGVLVGAQGLADRGKEAAKAEGEGILAALDRSGGFSEGDEDGGFVA